jgi:hypothetical protein
VKDLGTANPMVNTQVIVFVPHYRLGVHVTALFSAKVTSCHACVLCRFDQLWGPILQYVVIGWLVRRFLRFLFLHAPHGASVLPKELPKESDQFRFFRAACLAHLQGSVGLILYIS